MTALVRRINAGLPSLDKAHAMVAVVSAQLHWARTADDYRNVVGAAKAVQELLKLIKGGKELQCEAGEVIVKANIGRATIEADEKGTRDKTRSLRRGARSNRAVTTGTALPKSQLMEESRRAPLLTLPKADRERYFAQCRKALVAPTTAGAAALAKLPEPLRQKAIAKLGDAEAHVPRAISDARREEAHEHLESIAAREIKAVKGVYDVVVIDPPWPMKKMKRDVRPNQVEFDYPLMTEAELAELSIPCTDDCHVWVWTTQTFVPMALRLLEAWRLRYAGIFVWHKPGGPQPFGLPQYNCEFAIHAVRGSPRFVTTKGFIMCFEAPRGEHSAKPEAFYDMVRRVTAGRRLDMFSRRQIEGFEGWGNEAGA